MLASVRWLNEYLVPANVTAQGAERALTDAGFPIESHTDLPDGDVRIDVEVTSNRGDCLSHIGLAREIAAATGGTLKLPTVPPEPTSGDRAGDIAAVDNQIPNLCPLFTARVIRGVKVGPSPAWLVRALESIGQRSISNVVDVTNFVAAEYGQPTHVFDLATIQKDGGKHALTVRAAIKGEKLELLDGQTVELRPGELVIADGPAPGRPVSLAGIMGGALTQVTARTTDVLFEAATWAPAAVRRAARRLGLRTDASHRFERIVDPRTIDAAARRAAALILELAGGRLLAGVIKEGPEPEPLRTVRVRPQRVRALLGIDVHASEMARVLRAHDIAFADEPGDWSPGADSTGEAVCTIPPHRPDLEREIDLIEEVARTIGLERLPILEKLPIRIAPEQTDERAARELAATLTGLGFHEAVTFTFISPKAAAPFLPAGMSRIDVCDDRRKAEPTLRPSIIPSLLACRRANKDRAVDAPGGVRLYEVSSVFGQSAPVPAVPLTAGSAAVSAPAAETRNLALIADALPIPGGKAIDAVQHAVRLIRGTLDAAARTLGGTQAKLTFEPVAGAPPIAAFEPGACAAVVLNNTRIGIVGQVSRAVQQAHDLDRPVVAAEVNLAALLALYPPRATVRALPAFPAIERDLSLIVPEGTTWQRIESLVHAANLALLDHDPGDHPVRFIGVYRGRQAGDGKKSVTLRLRFRDPTRTLRREEVDPQMQSLVDLSAKELGAAVRLA